MGYNNGWDGHSDGDEEGDGIPFGSPPNRELPTNQPVIPADYDGPALVPGTGPANDR